MSAGPALAELLTNLGTLRVVLAGVVDERPGTEGYTASSTARIAVTLLDGYVEAAQRPRCPTCTGPLTRD